MGEKPALSDAIRGALERFRTATGIERVLVFGSQARGDGRPDSDLDIILIDPRFEGTPFHKRSVGLRQRIDLEIGVDILCYTPDEFDSLQREHSLVRSAADDGVLV